MKKVIICVKGNEVHTTTVHHLRVKCIVDGLIQLGYTCYTKTV